MLAALRISSTPIRMPIAFRLVRMVATPAPTRRIETSRKWIRPMSKAGPMGYFRFAICDLRSFVPEAHGLKDRKSQIANRKSASPFAFRPSPRYVRRADHHDQEQDGGNLEG